MWDAAAVHSGHVGALRDVAWDSQGKMLFSVGEDRTCRVFVPQKVTFTSQIPVSPGKHSLIERREIHRDRSSAGSRSQYAVHHGRVQVPLPFRVFHEAAVNAIAAL